MLIEPATVEDLEALHALIHSAYRGDSARRGWTHEADLLDGQRTDPEALAATLADARQLILVARDGGDLAGCVSLTDKGGGTGYIGLVTVDPRRQSAGLGRRLLDAVEAEARARFAATRAEMAVIAQRTDLLAWYERRGYRITGERRPFLAADPRFGLPRRDDLQFVVLEKPL